MKTLLKMVEDYVDKGIAEYQEAHRQDPDRTGWPRFAGCIPYGAANEPRENQIKSGMEYYHRERQRQREVQEAIVKLRAAQRR